ncbi:MAG: PorT family protein [Bacteroidales bacterium]|nr:PorT family protein [Bacteroidales bacterium]
MNQIKLFAILLAVASTQLSAQKPSNEFVVHTGGGLPVSLSKEASTAGFSGEAGVGFTVFLNRYMGVHLAAGWGISNMDIRVDSLRTLTRGLLDANGEYFDLHTNMSDYSEHQRTTFLSIPVMLQFQSNLAPHGFYAMGGTKILFRYQTTYESGVATFYNAAYYPAADNWAATQKIAGLGLYDGRITTGSFDLALHVALAFEAGMKWRVGKNAILYTGAYLDYGLTDPVKNQRKSLNDYIAPDLHSTPLLAFADKINSTTAGVKLRLSFSRSEASKIRRDQQKKGLGLIPCP